MSAASAAAQTPTISAQAGTSLVQSSATQPTTTATNVQATNTAQAAAAQSGNFQGMSSVSAPESDAGTIPIPGLPPLRSSAPAVRRAL